jgi:UDP-glucose 4-epimerase
VSVTKSLGGERVLVTGASGFIGSRMVDRLRSEEVEIHAVSRKHEPGTHQGIHWWRADIADGDAVTRVVSSIEPHLIFDLAGESRAGREIELVRPTLAANLAGTVNVLLAAQQTGCRRVVLAGSLEEPDLGVAQVPSSPYAASKSAAQSYARMFHVLYGVPVVTLRVFMVYGPGQRDLRKLIPYTITSLLRGTPPQVSSGRREIDWVYVDDVADAFLAAAAVEGMEGETVDVGSGRLCSVREIVERLSQIIAPAIEPSFGALADRPLEQERAADTGSTFAKLGWSATTSLDEGLKQTVEWYERLLAADSGSASL